MIVLRMWTDKLLCSTTYIISYLCLKVFTLIIILRCSKKRSYTRNHHTLFEVKHWKDILKEVSSSSSPAMVGAYTMNHGFK